MSRSALALLAVVALAAVAAVAWLATTRSTAERAPSTAAAQPSRPPATPASVRPPAPVDRAEAGRERAPEPDSEPAPSGDLHALLAWLERRAGAPPVELVADATEFASRFARVHRESPRDAHEARARLREIAADGATLVFEPGVWRIGGLERDDGTLPADLTLAGKGSQQTLLLLDGLRAAGDVVRLRFRDCTVSTGDRPLVDASSGFASVELERVRVVGFDGGVGASPVLRARGLAVRVRDGEILGAFGRAPGSGSLFEATRGALLARIERTRIATVRLDRDAWQPAAAVRFVSSSIEDAIDDPASVAGQRAAVAFESTRVARLAAGTRLARIDLETLFPRWQQRLR